MPLEERRFSEVLSLCGNSNCMPWSDRPSFDDGRQKLSLFSGARTIPETVPRDRKDGCAIRQPQGLEPESYANTALQVTRSEDARLPV